MPLHVKRSGSSVWIRADTSAEARSTAAGRGAEDVAYVGLAPEATHHLSSQFNLEVGLGEERVAYELGELSKDKGCRVSQ